eukprot:m.45075 g.45075  ORF g.45075 m.45075 type:complete len:380 (-) comp10863_c0_seq1:4339-5478(-)
MGAFLSVPVSDKDTATGEGAGLTWGLSAMQGYRQEMEDAHIATTDMEKLPGHGFFAVFDGHGGDSAAIYSGSHFTDNIFQSSDFDAAKIEDTEMLSTCLRNAHFFSDTDMWEHSMGFQTLADHSGCTAVSCIVTPSHYIFANCGDSRAILVGEDKVLFATTDHKPTDPIEKQRIEKARGYVQMARVNGNLAVSRSLGDFNYKDVATMKPEEQKVSCEPDMTVIARQDTDQYVMLCCDGIWDVMTNDNVQEFVHNQLKAGYNTVDTCSRLLDYCLQKDSKDNMSAVLVLLPGAPKPVEGFEAPEVIQPPPTEADVPTGPGNGAVDGNALFQQLLMQMGGTMDPSHTMNVEQAEGVDGSHSSDSSSDGDDDAADDEMEHLD